MAIYLDDLLTAEQVAEMVGVKANTIHTYHSRGILPPPVRYFADVPVWERATISHWLAHRPGRGVRVQKWWEDEDAG